MSSEAELQAVCGAIEHTLLSAVAGSEEVDALCAQAREHGFAAVCVHPVFVARCRDRLDGSAARVVTVIGFPLGANLARCKAYEAELAVADGADELDMVMRLGAARSGDWSAVEDDVRGVVQAAQGRAVKLIIETGLLTDLEKERACEAAVRSGAAYVKTCTGHGPGAATVHDVNLLARVAAGRIRIKASGGVRSAAQASALLAAGAQRLGTTAGVQIAAELAAYRR
jgi:deoxyribose-phosphate aldolase